MESKNLDKNMFCQNYQHNNTANLTAQKENSPQREKKEKIFELDQKPTKTAVFKTTSNYFFTSKQSVCQDRKLSKSMCKDYQVLNLEETATLSDNLYDDSCKPNPKQAEQPSCLYDDYQTPNQKETEQLLKEYDDLLNKKAQPSQEVMPSLILIKMCLIKLERFLKAGQKHSLKELNQTFDLLCEDLNLSADAQNSLLNLQRLLHNNKTSSLNNINKSFQLNLSQKFLNRFTYSTNTHIKTLNFLLEQIMILLSRVHTPYPKDSTNHLAQMLIILFNM